MCDTRLVPGDLVSSRGKTLSTKTRPSTSTISTYAQSTHGTSCTPGRVEKGNFFLFLLLKEKKNMLEMLLPLFLVVVGMRGIARYNM